MLIYVDIVFVCVRMCQITWDSSFMVIRSMPSASKHSGCSGKNPIDGLITFPDYPPMWVYNLSKPFFPMAYMTKYMTRSDMAIHPGTGMQTSDVSLVILFLTD